MDLNDKIWNPWHGCHKCSVRSNYLVMSNLFGVVMKYSELLSAERGN